MFLLKPIATLLRRSLLSLQAQHEVARFEGIVISDLNQDPGFRETALAALRLIKDLDARRFRRIQRHINWIVNVPLPYGGAEYSYSTQTCRLDFERSFWKPYAGYEFALCARILVHEATHGVVDSRRISYSAKMRSRIERLCVREEQRFLTRMAFTEPEIAKFLWDEFDEARWHKRWRDSHWRSLMALTTRLSRRRRTEREEQQLAHR